ncbi:hypothetical protein AZE42_11718 [Rhizopogon vesiculosus]|uniref:Uncharacterized protein n=1 Tax=Rhizopogon vesiculosus TaxID=180088 RepID=A0A1J8R749_9AGAM|nr:hypothetical protein AZE42_11718 [Rhizopogon vesiculosus]
MTSSFTLSSGTTDDSSASYALFDGKPHEDPCNNTFAAKLKKLYYSRGCEASDEDLQQQKRISDSPSVGIVAARMMPGLADTPGAASCTTISVF